MGSLKVKPNFYLERSSWLEIRNDIELERKQGENEIHSYTMFSTLATDLCHFQRRSDFETSEYEMNTYFSQRDDGHEVVTSTF